MPGRIQVAGPRQRRRPGDQEPVDDSLIAQLEIGEERAGNARLYADAETDPRLMDGDDTALCAGDRFVRSVPVPRECANAGAAAGFVTEAVAIEHDRALTGDHGQLAGVLRERVAHPFDGEVVGDDVRQLGRRRLLQAHERGERVPAILGVGI